VTHDPHAAERAKRQLHLEKGTFVEQGQAAARTPAGVAS
jgi:ABC-type lipoprotein export system ATPase subunit